MRTDPHDPRVAPLADGSEALAADELDAASSPLVAGDGGGWRVTLIAADPLVRGGLRAALGEDRAIDVRAAIGFEGVRAADAGAPAAWLDVDALVVDAVTATDTDVAQALGLGIPTIALVDPSDAAIVATRAPGLWTAGVHALLDRHHVGERLGAAIRAVAAGLRVVDVPLTLASAGSPATPAPDPLAPKLTPREHEVLQCMVDGLSNPDIARTLGVSPHTAKFHVNAILDKLGAQTRTEAVVLAVRAGLVHL